MKKTNASPQSTTTEKTVTSKPKPQKAPDNKPQVEKEEQQDIETSENISGLFADINVTMKSGHLTRDAEIVGEERRYVKLRLATNKQYHCSDGEIKTNTNYFNALISHHLSESFELAKTFKKGDWIYLKGEDSTRPFDTPEGYKQTASTIFAYHVVLKKEKQADAVPSSDSQTQAVPATSEALPA